MRNEPAACNKNRLASVLVVVISAIGLSGWQAPCHAEDRRTLYLCATSALYRIDLLVPGIRP